MSAPPPPPAAAIAPVRTSTPLGAKLARLEAELDAALAGGLEGRAAARLLRAEAITDRLLEGEPPGAWLAEHYFVEARLRQLQSLADRVVARMRRGESGRALESEVDALRRAVAALRGGLSAPAGEPPTPLDTLLARVPSEEELARMAEEAGG